MRVERLPAVLAFQCGVATRGLMPGIRIRNVCFYCFPNAAMEEWFPTENALRVPRAPSPQLSAFFSVSSLKSSCYTCLIYRSIKEPNNRTCPTQFIWLAKKDNLTTSKLISINLNTQHVNGMTPFDLALSV